MSEPWTKGPWAVHSMRAAVVPAAHLDRPLGGNVDREADLAMYAQEICLMQWPDRHRSEREVRANATLCAAAPDLFEALLDARTRLRGAGMLGGADDPVNSALSRARGEAS